MKRFVIGDIHGNFKGMMAALDGAGFDAENDYLYAVGDYVDGHAESKEVIEYLSSLKNFTGCIGNHDWWFMEWMRGERMYAPYIWYSQGGAATLESYDVRVIDQEGLRITEGDIPRSHHTFFNGLVPFIELDDDRVCIVHAGWIPSYQRIKDSDSYQQFSSFGSRFTRRALDFFWDRGFWRFAHNHKNPPYDKVFIGHTANESHPEKRKKIWNIDSSGGWHGKITVMDMDTEEYWQSEEAKVYYPDFEGR